jgi:hypothetical protein
MYLKTHGDRSSYRWFVSHAESGVLKSAATLARNQAYEEFLPLYPISPLSKRIPPADRSRRAGLLTHTFAGKA